MALSQVAPKDLKAKFLEKFSMRTDSDAEPCCISGLVCLPDDRIICLDNNNQKMKVFDAGCTFMYSADIDKDICGAVAISQYEVAVCCGSNISRYVVGVDEAKRREKQFLIGEHASCMSFGGNKYAVMCKNKSRTIKILDQSGNVLEDLSLAKVLGDLSDLNLFLLLDQDGTRIYLTSRTGCVSCINISGKLIWKTTITEQPSSLLQLDNTAMMIFCASTSKVIIIDTTGKLINEFTQNQELNCGAHACRQKRSVFVSCMGSDYISKLALFSK